MLLLVIPVNTHSTADVNTHSAADVNTHSTADVNTHSTADVCQFAAVIVCIRDNYFEVHLTEMPPEVLISLENHDDTLEQWLLLYINSSHIMYVPDSIFN